MIKTVVREVREDVLVCDVCEGAKEQLGLLCTYSVDGLSRIVCNTCIEDALRAVLK